MKQFKVERTFSGTQNLDEILYSLIEYYLEKTLKGQYYSDRVNTISSDIQKGVEK